MEKFGFPTEYGFLTIAEKNCFAGMHNYYLVFIEIQNGCMIVQLYL